MVVVPIVEGHGDAAAIPVLLRRLVDLAKAWDAVRIGQPIRCNRNQLLQEAQLRKRVRVARLREDCGAIMVVFDSDRDCPVERAGQVREWAVAEAAPGYCDVVLAQREYEAWFLATVESLRTHRSVKSDAVSLPHPESPLDAKGRLEAMMRISYSERTHQPAFSAIFCMADAYACCRSFRKLVDSFGRLMEGFGVDLSAWPRAWQKKTGT